MTAQPNMTRAFLPSRRQEAWRRSPVRHVAERFGQLPAERAPWLAPSAPVRWQLAQASARIVVAGDNVLIVERPDENSGLSCAFVANAETDLSLPPGPAGTESVARTWARGRLELRFAKRSERPAPVEIVCLPADGAPSASDASSSALRVEVAVEAGAEGALLQRFTGGARAASLKLELASAARFELAQLGEAAEDDTLLCATAATLAAQAQLSGLTLARGGRYQRFDWAATLAGEGASARLHSAQFGTQRTQIETLADIHHTARGTRSDLLHRSLAADASETDFVGGVRIARGASGSEAHQSARSLLSTVGATAFNKPELWIDTDDVSCSHGASVGNLDAQQLFYLRSRGLSEAAAQRLLVDAFFAELRADEKSSLLSELDTVLQSWVAEQAG